MTLVAVCSAQYGGYGYRHRGYGGLGAGSTAAGSYAAGMGNLVQSQGMYNQMTAQAMISAQQAQTLALDNKLKATQTYFDMRKINQESRAAEAARVNTPNEDAKYANRHAPVKTLTVSQLDPVSGQIGWPPALMSDQFSAQRAQIQDIFTRRSQNQAGSDSYLQVRSVVDGIQSQLDTQVKDMHPQDFVDSRRFLNQLVDATHSSDTAMASAK
jgi:hypothetical protein